MLRRGLAITALLCLASPAAAENIIGDTVTLRALDKVSAQTQDFTMPVGDVLKFGTLDIQVQHCETRPPEEFPETYVFMQIKDRGVDGIIEDGEEVPNVFSGWMFASSPSISALDHSVYDIWPVKCEANTPAIRGRN